jgi:polyhydroxyalkanoate synthesis repressor PhaR
LLKKLQVLAGAFRLTTFTVAELSKACGVSQNTIHTALARVPEEWFKSTVVSGGTRGGQRRRYILSVAGAKGIRQMLGRLPTTASSVLVEAAHEPIGLSAARASLERILLAGPSTARVLRENALRSLEWAEAEMSDGGFTANAQALRAQIEALRATIDPASDQKRKVPRSTLEARVASISKAAERGAVKNPLTRSELIDILAEVQRDLEQDSVDVECTVSRLQKLVDAPPSQGAGMVPSDVRTHPSRHSGGFSEPRTIKKYPNKRLYDTVENRYITLADIRKLVIKRIDFIVIDKKRQEDITHSVLFQVIAEQERGERPLMSRDLLSQIIRSYGGVNQEMIGSYLEQSLNLFDSQLRDARYRVEVMTEAESALPVNNLAQKNYRRWRQVQDEIWRTLSNAGSGRTDSTDDDKFSATDWFPAGAPKG